MPISTIGTDGLSTSPTLTTPKATTTIGVGNATPAASGAGVTFPAALNASSDVNTLDDYEEGTWTPNQGGGLTVSGTFGSSGRYIKIGRFVYIEGFLLGSTNISSAAVGVLCSNLPFTSTAGNNAGMGGLTNNSINQANSCWVNPNTTILYGTEVVSATAALWFSLTYQSAS